MYLTLHILSCPVNVNVWLCFCFFAFYRSLCMDGLDWGVCLFAYVPKRNSQGGGGGLLGSLAWPFVGFCIYAPVRTRGVKGGDILNM
ncbi:hypothetical protein GE09DRAFT_1153400 [Coniochaeta sp. 2T2.1]|nr:hypothetical protein GE09DRAFT_1153400 [Coniochaeta sp. 2T2.1]